MPPAHTDTMKLHRSVNQYTTRLLKRFLTIFEDSILNDYIRTKHAEIVEELERRGVYREHLPRKKKHAKARTDSYKYPKQIKKHKKRVWKIFSDYIRERDCWTCYTCGKIAHGKGMHGGHYISRTNGSTMFDEMNVHAQCYRCNIHLHGNLAEYTLKLIKDYGLEKVEELKKKSKKTHRFTHEELKEIYQTTEKKLKKLKEEHAFLDIP